MTRIIQTDIRNLEIPEGVKVVTLAGVKYKQCKNLDKTIWVSEINTYFRTKNGKIAICSHGKDKGSFIRHPAMNVSKIKSGKQYMCSLQVCANGKVYNFAHLVMDAWKNQVCPGNGYDVDHINTDSCDNRACNLQFITHKQNMKKLAVHMGFLF